MERPDKIRFEHGGDTLVLNKDGSPLSVLPISTISWRDAVKAVVCEEVEVLHNYDDWVVRSQNLVIPVPAVVMMHTFVKVGRALKFSANHIKLRDDNICQYCGKWFSNHDLTMDHVVPRFSGGKTKWENIVAACGPCNGKKSHYSNMKPLTLPRKPSYYELAAKARNRPIIVRHETWNTYLGWDEDKIKLVKV